MASRESEAAADSANPRTHTTYGTTDSDKLQDFGHVKRTGSSEVSSFGLEVFLLLFPSSHLVRLCSRSPDLLPFPEPSFFSLRAAIVLRKLRVSG